MFWAGLIIGGWVGALLAALTQIFFIASKSKESDKFDNNSKK